MSSAKGRHHENAVVEDLQDVWPDAQRRIKEGIYDAGDVDHVGEWFIEVKYRKTTKGWRIPQWVGRIMVQRTRLQRRDGGERKPWMLILRADKRLKTNPNEDLVVMPLEQAKRLIVAAGAQQELPDIGATD